MTQQSALFKGIHLSHAPKWHIMTQTAKLRNNYIK